MIAIACAHENALRWQVWGLVSWGETLLMKKSGMAVAMFAAGVMFGPNGALAADVNLVTKAPPLVTPAMPATCTGVSQFFLTDCVLSWYGISVYGAVDVGGGYQTHGAPFNGYFPQGASYSIQKMNRQAMWGLAPGGLSASNIGVRGAESIGGDWKAIFQVEAGFDPYSLRLSNGGNALFGNLGVPLNQQSVNADSSRGGQFYNSVGFVGVSSPTYGTLTFFRQNSLTLDGLAAYDPLALSYAFSQIGFQSVATGAGITETARASTSVKYRYQYGDFRAGCSTSSVAMTSTMGQTARCSYSSVGMSGTSGQAPSPSMASSAMKRMPRLWRLVAERPTSMAYPLPSRAKPSPRRYPITPHGSASQNTSSADWGSMPGTNTSTSLRRATFRTALRPRMEHGWVPAIR